MLDVVVSPQSPAVSVNVQCLLTSSLTDPSGKTCNYVIVADDLQHIHLILQGSIVMTMTVPAVVTAVSERSPIIRDSPE